LIYGLVVERGLCPRLALRPWNGAAREVRRIHDAGVREAARAESVRQRLERRPRFSELDLSNLDSDRASHVYTGVDEDGLLAPYASFFLLGQDRTRLRISGRFLGRRELVGTRVRLHVEEFEIGSLSVEESGPFEEVFELPAQVRGREYVNVRLEAEDWALVGPAGESCAVLGLERLALE